MKPLIDPMSRAAANHSLAEMMAAQQTDMAAQRTGLAYQRNRFAADRTLMAIMRTSLLMIGFGVLIFAGSSLLAARDAIGPLVPRHAPGLFGLALAILGMLLLAAGIAADIRYRGRMRHQQRWLRDAGWDDATDPNESALIVIAAIGLLLIGAAAIFVIIAQI